MMQVASIPLGLVSTVHVQKSCMPFFQKAQTVDLARIINLKIAGNEGGGIYAKRPLPVAYTPPPRSIYAPSP